MEHGLLIIVPLLLVVLVLALALGRRGATMDDFDPYERDATSRRQVLGGIRFRRGRK